MGMDEAGAYSLCVLEVVGDNKLRNSELLVCKQHKQLARTRFWVLPPSCVQVGWARARGYIQLQRRCFWARIFFGRAWWGSCLGPDVFPEVLLLACPLHLTMRMMQVLIFHLL